MGDQRLFGMSDEGNNYYGHGSKLLDRVREGSIAQRNNIMQNGRLFQIQLTALEQEQEDKRASMINVQNTQAFENNNVNNNDSIYNAPEKNYDKFYEYLLTLDFMNVDKVKT